MLKMQKATALDNLAAIHRSEFEKKTWLVSTKYDGNMIFIEKIGDRVRFFTSNGKEFYLGGVADWLKTYPGDFTFTAEFMYGCRGKLGDRTKSAILTTFRTDFAKGIESSYNPFDIHIQVFDIISDGRYHERIAKCHYILTEIQRLRRPAVLRENIFAISLKALSGKEAITWAKDAVKLGWEGAMAVDPDSTYQAGKRVPYAVKLKFRKTADLLCIDVEQGIGKCNGIGALVLQDKAGRVVKVGSGLDYSSDTRSGDQFIGKVIEIEYEQILDTYIQPVFVCVRDDKTKEDID